MVSGGVVSGSEWRYTNKIDTVRTAIAATKTAKQKSIHRNSLCAASTMQETDARKESNTIKYQYCAYNIDILRIQYDNNSRKKKRHEREEKGSEEKKKEEKRI